MILYAQWIDSIQLEREKKIYLQKKKERKKKLISKFIILIQFITVD